MISRARVVAVLTLAAILVPSVTGHARKKRPAMAHPGWKDNLIPAEPK